MSVIPAPHALAPEADTAVAGRQRRLHRRHRPPRRIGPAEAHSRSHLARHHERSVRLRARAIGLRQVDFAERAGGIRNGREREPDGRRRAGHRAGRGPWRRVPGPHVVSLEDRDREREPRPAAGGAGRRRCGPHWTPAVGARRPFLRSTAFPNSSRAACSNVSASRERWPTSARAADGRTVRRARCPDAGDDAACAARRVGGDRRHRPVHHPRYRRGGDPGRPDRDHEREPGPHASTTSRSRFRVRAPTT